MNKLILAILLNFSALATLQAAPADVSQNPPIQTQQTPAPSNPIGFQEWKKNQVFDARKNLDEFKSPQLAKMAEVSQNVEKAGDNSSPVDALPEPGAANGSEVAKVEAGNEASNNLPVEEKAEKLRQLEFNLEIAQGLTIHDYFALYLKNKSKEEMAVAIQKLSPEELSELLMAYRKSLYGVPEGPTSSATALQ